MNSYSRNVRTASDHRVSVIMVKIRIVSSHSSHSCLIVREWLLLFGPSVPGTRYHGIIYDSSVPAVFWYLIACELKLAKPNMPTAGVS